ncbi:MAG TPA: hypothetical protein VGX23_32990 [Actinocrinis sp.]|nr:hypothetical protein [Actinocrinis sp.]
MKQLPRISALAAGSALALGLVAGPAMAAGATPGATAGAGKGGAGLSSVQALAATRVNGRIAEIKALQMAVSAATNLTSADKTSLSNLLSTDLTAMNGLSTKMAAQTTVAAVRADEVTMVDDYRIYLLVAPKTHLTIAFDTEASVITKLQGVYSVLSANVAKQTGGGTSAEKSELADMQTQIGNAQSALNGQVSAVLAIQPGANAAAISGQVKPLRTTAQGIRKDLGQADSDAKQVRTALK